MTLNAKELMQLPLKERRDVLRKQAEGAKELYEEDGELRKFKAEDGVREI